ncbi:UDP-N-acetylmuramate dehydrogenase [Agromyces seonyuensis]|uniref:UDP-N-acetylenolpyruvoylglucosamine reductase n=1 Tax=Agromyces seonyuensis TaxID=2662446 RepID=A0A6I4P2X1_9MICO|nr:UDP-N-acetylmuramate dehydrogenase [Agromyces seonyuensis]MWB98479.1 UDP-N-acetylmuramate dehydrogenase [Agromyces seonyuensis]
MTEHVRLADLTTLGVGGPAEHLVTATTQRDLVDLASAAWDDPDGWLVLGGGSNLLVGDEPVPGTVIRVATKGIEELPGARSGTVRLRVQAGEVWDDLVAHTVSAGWSGLEALSGIPGLAGAAPVQNIGAYGQELGGVLTAIEFLAEGELAPVRMPAAELELGYRSSVLKHGHRGVVVSIELELHDTAGEQAVLGEALGAPVAYAQLANALGVQLGDRVSISAVRETVLALRRSKGMVLDPADPDTASAGSFFTNPIVDEHIARTLPSDAPRWYLEPDAAPEVIALGSTTATPLDEFRAYQASMTAVESREDAGSPVLVKVSAAWLIEHAGIRRGFALPGSRAAISSKHTLALTNRGGASAAELVQLARFVQARVQAEYGIRLVPEPVWVGIEED